ncbi:MAG: TRAP transporter small permease [Bacteroidota bacterium]
MVSKSELVRASRTLGSERPPGFGWVVNRILDAVMRITENFGAVLLTVMTAVICWEIFSRTFAKYITGINSPWTEEVAMIFMVWFGLTGAAIGIRKATHIGVEFVVALFPKKVGQVMLVLVDLLILAFSGFLLVEGFKYTKEMIGVELPATGLSRGYFVYAAAPVAAVLMLTYGLEAMVKNIKALVRKEGEAE